MSTGLINCATGKALLNCSTGKGLLNCYGECIDTITVNHLVDTRSCGGCDTCGSTVTINTGKSYPYPVRLKLVGAGTIVDDWSTINGTVWHSTTTTRCSPSLYKTINAQTFVEGYILATNGTGAIITIPANTEIVFTIVDTMGVFRRLVATFCVYYHLGTP